MKFFIATTCVLLLSAGIYADTETTQDTPNPSAFERCLEEDSISCLQMTVFRRAKSVFDNPEIELFGGVSLMKSADGRRGKALNDNSIAVETAPSVEARSSELSSYFITNMKNFFQERSLNLNFANTARSIARAIPDDIKADVTGLVVEARTLIKKKRTLKKLIPVILGIGAKLAVLSVGALFGVAFLVKKALIVSVIAFGMALFASISSRAGSSGGSSGGLLGGLGGLFGGGKSNAGYVSGGNAGWSSGSSDGWSSGSSGWDSNGAYSAPVAQAIAYNGYKQARR